MKSTEPSKIAEVIKAFVSSPMALTAIQQHRNYEQRAIEALKENICALARDEIEMVVSKISSAVEVHVIPSNFNVHNVSADNVRFEYKTKSNGVETTASIDDAADLVIQIKVDENKNNELMKDICGCIKVRYNINAEIKSALDAIYPPESKVILIIEGASFNFGNTYGG